VKKFTLAAFILASVAAASAQNAFERCVEECMRSGISEASCRTEICWGIDTTVHDVISGQGNPLYLYSYELKGPAPVVDGCLMSRDGEPWTLDAMDEWKSACSRTIILNDSGIVQMFLTNSPETLYVGFTYEHGNNGDGSGVHLYFDQGNNTRPSVYHGSGDMKLSAPNGIANEQACAISKTGGSFTLRDRCWNGADWIDDGDGATDFQGASYFFNTDLKVHHSEFAIPLQSLKTYDSTNSDLNVKFDDTLGFYMEVVKTGSGSGTWHWLETNGNVAKADTFPFWARIQLSVKREYFTFYTGRCANPAPVLDGAIQEAAWSGAYQREMILSNFHYGTYRSKIWCLEDSAQDAIYIGMRVYDKTHSPADYCQVYFEEDGTDSTAMTRNYYLDDNAENSMRVTDGNQVSDKYWSLSNRGWTDDPSASASQGAAAGETETYADYEFKVQRTGGPYNINIPRGGMMGFIIRYHDGDKTGEDLSNFYWEYTTNNDAQLLENPMTFIATGWTNLQLGGPFIQVVKPSTSDSLHGTVPIEIFSGKDSLKAVTVFLSSDTTHPVSLTYQGNGTWTGAINVSFTVPNGAMLIVRAVTAGGVTYERIVNKVTIADTEPVGPRSVKLFGVNVAQRSADGLQFQVMLQKPGDFTLEVFTVSGVKVWTYHNGQTFAGRHMVPWKTNRPLGNGTYLLALQSGRQRLVQKFAVCR
jgi:hypothetical protein